MRQRILLVGASVRAAIESATKAGYCVNAFDLFADQDSVAAVEQSPGSQLMKVENFESPEIVRATKYCDVAVLLGGVETRIELVRRIGNKIRIAGTTPDCLERLHREKDVFEFLHLSNITSPSVKTKLGQNDPPELWLRKQNGSASGNGVRNVTDEDLGSEQVGSYFQQVIKGANWSATFVSIGSKDSTGRNGNRSTFMLSHSMQLVGDARLGCGEFCYCGSIESNQLPKEQRQLMHACASAIASEFGIKGIWGIDFVTTATQVFPVDINCRMTASLEIVEPRFRGKGFSGMVDLQLQSCADDTCVADFERDLPAQDGLLRGKLILFNRFTEPIYLSSEQLHRLTQLQTANLRIADIPNANEVIAAHHPMVTIKSSGEDELQLRAELFDLAETIYDQLAHDGQ